MTNANNRPQGQSKAWNQGSILKAFLIPALMKQVHTPDKLTKLHLNEEETNAKMIRQAFI